ncbi:uncharacterized protein RJT20DRAFT_56602 [Scheffersomyces xylosifermentans]|uniref:uncharacterized protein n=1 Tax=Scheffersomyces xylosifermentans TaxID=1304137 RepID=UPI00315DE3C9
MAFVSQSSGIASSIFLALYSLYTIFAILVVSQVRKWRTIYTSLLVHGLLRVGGQLCGVAFAVVGWQHFQWLIAYLVLSAEGYFVLILASFHLIANAQQYVLGTSWIRPSKDEINQKVALASNWKERWQAKRNPARIFHLLLIPANAFIISGGSMLAGLTIEELNNGTGKVTTSKVLRTIGQAVFLFQSAIAIYFALRSFFIEGIRHYNIYAVFIVAPFLLVRGIFGVLSIYVDKMDYYLISNYTEAGFSSSFVAYEYCMATTMEFVTACVYICTYFLEKKKYRSGEQILSEESDKTNNEKNGTFSEEKTREEVYL